MPRPARAFAAVLLIASLCACQLKSTPVPSNFITVDPANFVLKGVDRFTDPNGTTTDAMIVVVKATYTNQEANPETIAADKFVLLDPDLMAVYAGLAGGDVNIPSMQQTQLGPGKSIDIAIGFRVPSSMSAARLAYRP